ncbi:MULTISPECIES: hypothetical protein [Streptomyces]|uniref:hypothetical protein n=1 Tax=Streptomyces TaxID=1883 RepID=UPI000A8F593A|nr:MULTISPECIES: hypothetical protein [Streptomyces]MDX2922604.1 hypothetical protein [Streptomyces sp. NE06-03C]
MTKEPAAGTGDEPLPFAPLPPGARGPLDPPPLGTPPPGFGPRLVIAEGVLTKAAGVADKVFDDFRKPARSVDEPTAKAARELAGWESAAALRTSLKNWQNQSKAAETWLIRIAESLRASSQAYTSTSQAVGQQFSVLRTYG